jgi:hypothetical protein
MTKRSMQAVIGEAKSIQDAKALFSTQEEADAYADWLTNQTGALCVYSVAPAVVEILDQ